MAVPGVAERPSVPRGVAVLVCSAAIVITIAGLQAVAGLVGPAVLALVLVIMVQPLRTWLARRVPDWAAAGACVLAVYVTVVGLSLAVLVATARFAALLPTYQAKFETLVQNLVARAVDLGIGEPQLQQMVEGLDLGRLAGVVADVLGATLGVATNLVFLLTLVLFMGMDSNGFVRQLVQARGERGDLVRALSSFARGTRSYLLVSTVFGLIVAVLDTIALALLGVPGAALWGLLAFITNYVPNIGFVIGLVPPAVLGLLEGGPDLMVAVIVIYSLLNVVIQSVIQPKFVGDAVGLSTTLTFVSLVFWTWVIGPLGALLAVPLSLFVKALLVEADPRSAWLMPLLSNRDRPVEPGS